MRQLAARSATQVIPAWRSPFENRRYDRTSSLSVTEREAIQSLLKERFRFGERKSATHSKYRLALARLVRPLLDVGELTNADEETRRGAVVVVLRECLHARRSYWDWSSNRWKALLGSTSRDMRIRDGKCAHSVRTEIAATAYLLGCFREVTALGRFRRGTLAIRIFGREAELTVSKVLQVVSQWGYGDLLEVESCTYEALLRNESPHLEHLSAAAIEGFRKKRPVSLRSRYFLLSKVLHALGIIERPLRIAASASGYVREDPTFGVPKEWRSCVERWTRTSALKSARDIRHHLCKVGRWLAAHHPSVTRPEQWTREIAIEYVAAVVRMRVGDYSVRKAKLVRLGEPIKPTAMSAELVAIRTFFVDCQEWGWIARRFDPRRSLALPRSIKALIGPNPRIVDDQIWPRLLWAGLKLNERDLPRGGRDGHQRFIYPLEYVRAVALVWLFAALRSDEIARLRVGCIRWLSGEADATRCKDEMRVCLLDVPTNKTDTAFTKPVDASVGQAIESWQRLRPSQPQVTDAKTNERVDLLFMYQARSMRRAFINESLIPILCRRAGVSEVDVRGRITSHRARSTIASQLFNARLPMSLSELQQWLGHTSPASTQHYVKITPTRLARAYADAGYYERNARAVDVLIDQDALKEGAATRGEPWRYYDLGHGLCSYEFFDRCAHRMACAKCDFYGPKESSLTQIVEAKRNILRVIQDIPLTDEERAAVDGDMRALERLEKRLAGIPTPSQADLLDTDSPRK